MEAAERPVYNGSDVVDDSKFVAQHAFQEAGFIRVDVAPTPISIVPTPVAAWSAAEFPRLSGAWAAPNDSTTATFKAASCATCWWHQLPVVAEVVAFLSSAGILLRHSGPEWWKSSTTYFRCDVAAITWFSALTFLLIANVVTAHLVRWIESGSRRIPWSQWVVMLRLFLQANACGLTVFALLDHAPIVLTQASTIGAVIALVGLCSSLCSSILRQGSGEASFAEQIPHGVSYFASIAKWKFATSWLLLSIAGFCTLLVKPVGKILDDQISIHEHFMLFYAGSFIISFVMIAVALTLHPRSRRLLYPSDGMSNHTAIQRRTPTAAEAVGRAVGCSFFVHVLSVMSLLGLSFAAVGVVALVICLARSALRIARMPQKPNSSRKSSRTSVTSKKKKKKPSKLKKLLTMMFMLGFGFLKVGAIFTVFLFDVSFVTKQMSKDAAGCSAVSSPPTPLPQVDARLLKYVGPRQLESGDASVEENAPAHGPSSPGLMGAGTNTVLDDMGLGGLGGAIKTFMTESMNIFNGMLSLEFYVPSKFLHCTGLRRLASACAVISSVCIVSVISFLDVLSILEASKEIAKSRAGSAGSFVTYILTIARVQIREFAATQLLQITIASCARLQAEAKGYVNQNCGYLVGPNDASWGQCPNFWHVPVELVSAFLLAFGFTCAFFVFIATLSGVLYGLPSAKWVMVAFFGKDLQLSNYGSKQETPPNTDWLGSSLANKPLARRMMRPVMGLAVTLGIWTTWASRTYQCGARQDWYEPVMEDDPETEEDERDISATADLVSWKAMYTATAKGISMVWLPLPLLGSLLSKTTTYLNEFVYLAFGSDGGNPSGDTSTMLKHFQEERPKSVQVLHWISQAALVFILLVIEFDLLSGLTLRQRLLLLGSCVLAVVVIASLRITLDISQQLQTYRSGKGLIESSEEILQNATLEAISDRPGNSSGDPLEGLPLQDTMKIAVACQELLELSWAKRGTLRREQKTFLVSAKLKGNPKAELAGYVLKAHANEKPYVTQALVNSAVILCLHESADAEIQSGRAKLAAHKEALLVAEAGLKARGNELQEWLEEEVRWAVVVEARKRAGIFEKWMKSGSRATLPSADQRCVKLVIKAFTTGTSQVTAVWMKSRKTLMDKPREACATVEAEVEVSLAWPAQAKPSSIAAKDVEVLRSWHKAHTARCVGQAPKDPHTSEQFSGEVSCNDAAPDDAKYGLDWLGAEMFEAQRSKCCRRQTQWLMKAAISAKGPDTARWETKVLDMMWKTTDDDCLEEQGPIKHRSDGTVTTRTKMWPEFDELGQFTTKDLMEELEASVRGCQVTPQTLLHAATFLDGANEKVHHESADQAAQRARLLAIARRMLAAKERSSSTPPPAQEEKEPQELSEAEFKVCKDSGDEVRQNVLERLRTVMSNENVDLDELSLALDEARREDVDMLLRDRAEEIFVRLTTRKQLCDEVTEALDSGNVPRLRESIANARVKGVLDEDFPDDNGTGLLARAQSKIFEAADDVKQELVKLRQTLVKAQEVEDDLLIAKAKEKLKEILRSNWKDMLVNAVNSNDVELLDATILGCEKEDISDEEELVNAKRHRDLLATTSANFKISRFSGQMPAGGVVTQLVRNGARAALRTALVQDPIDATMLKLTIEKATSSGICGREILRARLLLASEESKVAAVRNVREAASHRDTHALKNAIFFTNELGVSSSRLLPAVDGLLGEEENTPTIKDEEVES